MSWRGLVRVVALIALLAVLGYGHVRYWYQPRERPATPRPGTALADLLASERFPAALWLPYPHQNLGLLMGEDDAYADYLEACARLAGLPPPVLPSFGSFPVVPAHEIALAADEEGEHFVVMARVYPGIALFARLAGRLAGNPWLAGGDVRIQDRPATVRWEAGVWTVRDADSRPIERAAGSPPSTDEKAGPALAVLAIHRPVEPFPVGRYRLERADGSFQVTSSEVVSAAVWDAARAVPPSDLVLMVMAGAGAEAVSPTPSPARALAFFTHQRASKDLPRAAVMNQTQAGDRARWTVPGEDLARIAGVLGEHEHAGWRIEALGEVGLASAIDLLPRLGRVAGSPTTGHAPLVWGLWADVPHTLSEVERLAAMLDDLPLIAKRERQRWHDAAVVLRPVAARFADLTVVVGAEPRAVRLRFDAHPPPASSP